MNHKTLVSIIIALSAILLPLGGWTLLTVSSSTARISVLEESKGDIKDRLTKIDDKLDLVLDEQRQVRADLRRSPLRTLPSAPAPLRRGEVSAP